MSIQSEIAKVAMSQYEDGETVFNVRDLLRVAYGQKVVRDSPGLCGDAESKALVVMKKMEASLDKKSIFFIPLTEVFFVSFYDVVPTSERDARRCVAGAYGGNGTVGFKLGEHDLITAVWRKHCCAAAVGHSKKEARKTRATSKLLQFDLSASEIENQIKLLTQD